MGRDDTTSKRFASAKRIGRPRAGPPSGSGVRHLHQSEPVGRGRSPGGVAIERGRLVERLIQLARAIDEVEIAQTERDFRIFDRDDNLRIYYLDGRKHARQTPWGAKLDAVAKWEGQQITVRTTGSEIGEVHETFGMEGRQLVFIVRIKNKNFQNEIVIRNYYDRSP